MKIKALHSFDFYELSDRAFLDTLCVMLCTHKDYIRSDDIPHELPLCGFLDNVFLSIYIHIEYIQNAAPACYELYLCVFEDYSCILLYNHTVGN